MDKHFFTVILRDSPSHILPPTCDGDQEGECDAVLFTRVFGQVPCGKDERGERSKHPLMLRFAEGIVMLGETSNMAVRRVEFAIVDQLCQCPAGSHASLQPPNSHNLPHLRDVVVSRLKDARRPSLHASHA
jgi:hypothetical protein